MFAEVESLAKFRHIFATYLLILSFRPLHTEIDWISSVGLHYFVQCSAIHNCSKLRSFESNLRKLKKKAENTAKCQRL